MCLTRGNKSTKQYEEAAQPSRPVPIAPVNRADRYEKPRRAPLVPLNPQARKRSEAQVKKTLRDAERVESNRQDRRFATSDRNADRIRERVLAKATENRARAPPPPPRRAARQEIFIDDSDSDSHKSAKVAPLNIRKKAPQPPQPPQRQKQHRAARPANFGNIIPALRSTARPVDESHKHPALTSSAKPVNQSHIHPAFRTTARPNDQSNIHPLLRTPARQVDQPHIHPTLRTTGNPALRSSIHPALRNLPATPARPQRRVSDSSQSSLERGIYSYLGSPENYPNSPRESEVSPLNVTQKLPYASSRKRR